MVNSSILLENCPWCAHSEIFRLRDGTSTRVCKNNHRWLQCFECSAFFDPDVTKNTFRSSAIWWKHYRFLCLTCIFLHYEEPCFICFLPLHYHTNINKPFKHTFTPRDKIFL